jgi:hypothetical protein
VKPSHETFDGLRATESSNPGWQRSFRAPLPPARSRGRPGIYVDLAAIAAPRVATYPKCFDESVPAAGRKDLCDHDVVNRRLGRDCVLRGQLCVRRVRTAVTHGHADHITPGIAENADLQIWGPEDVITQLTASAVSSAQLHAVGPGDTFETAGFQIAVLGGSTPPSIPICHPVRTTPT